MAHTSAADSLSTMAAPLPHESGAHHPALDLLFDPRALLADVLAYAGPDGIAKLRNFGSIRIKMSKLSSVDLDRVGLPCHLNQPLKDQSVQFLRGIVMEQSNSTSHPRRRQQQKQQAPRLTPLGMLALAKSPLASDCALENLCRLVMNFPIWVSRNRRRVSEAIANHPGASARVLERLIQMDYCHFHVRRAVARHANASQHLLAKLAQDESSSDANIRAAVAHNPQTSTSTLSKLCCTDTSLAVLKGVATNPCTLTHDLEWLGMHPDHYIRSMVATNPNTPTELLEALAADDEYQVRLSAASHVNLPLVALQQLAQDRNWTIRAQVARNPSTAYDNELLDRLTLDNVFEVRWALARNPCIEAESLFHSCNNPYHQPILAALSKDGHVLEYLSTMVDDKDQNVLLGIAANVNTPHTVLRYLAASSTNIHHEVREAVADNPNTPLDVLDEMSKDDNPQLRARIASNPSCPPEILHELSQDGRFDEQVLECLAENPNTTPETLSVMTRKALVGISLVEEQADASTHDAASDKFWCFLLTRIAHHAHTPLSVLVQLSKQKMTKLKEAVACSLRLPPMDLARLGREQVEGDDDSVMESLAENELVQRVVDHLSCTIAAPVIKSS